MDMAGAPSTRNRIVALRYRGIELKVSFARTFAVARRAFVRSRSKIESFMERYL